MPIPRRTFLATSSGAILGLSGLSTPDSASGMAPALASPAQITSSVCPLCAVGCGLLVTSADGRVLNLEGDPAHPVNRGALCARGSALLQLAPNDRRLTRVLYRPAHGAEWEEKSWQWAIARIAERVQATRDASFEPTDSQGRTVNRTPAMAVLGGAVLSNEECYLLGKLARSLGLVAIEHQALAAESSAEAALEATLGSGAMPLPWTDLARAQCILVVGANPAENHPVAMQWIDAARRRGTKLIVVDPRLTRTAAVADLHVPLRPGTDIALFGAVVRILLERGWIDHPYLARNTDAEHMLADGRSVFETLREHFSRYTPERAADVCGVPPETIEQLAHWFGATHAEGQAGSLVLGRGCTQHAAGTQIVRTLAIVQLLLGNAGVPGGGVCPLVGSANARGATDFGLRSDRLPAHLPAPRPDDASLAH